MSDKKKKPCNCKEQNQKNLSIISKKETMAKNNTKQVEIRYVGNARRVAVEGAGVLKNGEWVKVREDVGLRLSQQKSFELKTDGRSQKSQEKDEKDSEEESSEVDSVEDSETDLSLVVIDEDKI